MTPAALDVLAALADRAADLGLPGPAALVGDWADADAVIAPSLEVVDGQGPPDRPDRFWLGYLGFPVRAGAAPLPEVAGGLTDGLLFLRDGVWSWESPIGAPCPEWVTPLVESTQEPARVDTSRFWTAEWTPPDEAPHLAAVESCREAIADGEVYQACICTRFTGRVDGDPLAYFADLAAATKPRKSAFLSGDWGAVASFSPESFLSRRGTTITSSPIKGTVPLDVDPLVLAESRKDIAENVMIVDLVRNDLGRVADTGTVRVPELLTVVGAPGVWHSVSTVSAEVGDVGNDALLDATFPPASVTGTPKIRAAELIARWEEFPRGVYCGAIGVAGPGLLDLNVAIRTVQIGPDGTATLGVGGGITYDSVPAAEWQECLDKASAIIAHTSSNDAP
ncbi:MAG: aminodeoxychorismate synthase component I [Gordonia sp. (in: high G+C Gram-positive bacteria)]|uniref:aminodeoxychorismate synthase component I n=1 Tax=Gordonia sp. (in: high G+C Gram-positive bacteria) TaxID=84139 RepID=UPI0039E54ADC